ncbi:MULTISPECIES: Na/Pi cotransporter family protein [Anaerotruncus]|uniref:Na/Pi cotransporter family protein n=1 Tax=Anaerotruncus TaxID=244127 RepID=UPI00082C06A5|nr:MULTISPECIES: Na/Pi cotransporter family protein [Anaerotruncus]
MDLFGFIKLLGGLAMFLYGMSLLGTGLERVSGGRLEKTLESLTSTVVKGVLLGAVVTAAIQSSSATTVIVVGLVNARVLKLRNAIGVIMGANIGTTITAHILRLSDLQSDNFFLLLLKPATLAPLASIIGVVLFMAAKRSKIKDIGQTMIGFGILFTGMFAMEAAVMPLSEQPAFRNLFATFANPIIGVLVGTFVTAAIQSSAASIGILQALSSTGFVTYSMAFPIIMGQNIGTCITPILASIGASKNAKRTAAVHVCFNILGTLIFIAFCYTYQSLVGFSFWELPIDKGGIANFHTIFNVCTTLLFIPLAGVLEKLACTIVRDKKGDGEIDITAITLDERLMVSPGLAVNHAREAVAQMGMLARNNYHTAVGLLLGTFDLKTVERLNETEDVVDKMEDRVETYLLKLSEKKLTDNESRSISELLHTCGEFERIADHSQNICECAQRMYDSGSKFSKRATEEMGIICDAVGEIVDLALDSFQRVNLTAAGSVEPLEEIIDEMEETLKDKHIERLRKGKCTVDAAFPFVEALSNLERIADHCSNVGVSVLTYDGAHGAIDRHEYVQKTRKEHAEQFQDKYIVYSTKYFNKIKK